MPGTLSTKPTSHKTNNTRLTRWWQHRSSKCLKTMHNTRVQISTLTRSALSAIEMVDTSLMNKLPMTWAAPMPTSLLRRSASGRSQLSNKWVRIVTVCRLQSIPQLRRMRCPTSVAPLNPSALSTEWSALMLTPHFCSRQHRGTAGLCEAQLPSLPLFICYGGEYNFLRRVSSSSSSGARQAEQLYSSPI